MLDASWLFGSPRIAESAMTQSGAAIPWMEASAATNITIIPARDCFILSIIQVNRHPCNAAHNDKSFQPRRSTRFFCEQKQPCASHRRESMSTCSQIEVELSNERLEILNEPVSLHPAPQTVRGDGRRALLALAYRITVGIFLDFFPSHLVRERSFQGRNRRCHHLTSHRQIGHIWTASGLFFCLPCM